jgi:hypothetical protein
VNRGRLARNTDTVREFLDRGRRSSAASLRQSAREGARRKKRVDPVEEVLRAAWAARAIAEAESTCANCGYQGPWVEVHHAIPKEILKRRLRSKGQVCPIEVLWHPDNALVVCDEPAPERCHTRHTLTFKRLPRRALRPENWRFARGLGAWAVELLERDYPHQEGDDA